MGTLNPPSPRRSTSFELVPPAGRRSRPVLTYEGKAVPWHVVARPALYGVPVLGQRITEAWREGA